MISYAFVMKNFIPLRKKVHIFHAQLGKIMCIYPQDHQAHLLATGSIILCDVQPRGSWYTFEYLEIIRSTHSIHVDQLVFIHQLMKICLLMIPQEVVVSDVFEYLLDLYRQEFNLTQIGRQKALLRMFILCDVIPTSPEAYRLAMLELDQECMIDESVLDRYVTQGWHEVLKKQSELVA